jgi:hypothetical protein
LTTGLNPVKAGVPTLTENNIGFLEVLLYGITAVLDNIFAKFAVYIEIEGVNISLLAVNENAWVLVPEVIVTFFVASAIA